MTPRKRRIKALHLCEISCVDRPAHELALATLIKNASLAIDPEPLETGENAMTIEQLTAEVAALKSVLEKSKADLAVLTKALELSPADRTVYDTLTTAEDQAAFLSGTENVRKSFADIVANANPVVYTADDQTVYRKSDDARLVKFAKEADEAKRATKAAEQALDDKRVADEAKKIAFIPGTDDLRAKVVKAIETLGDEGKAVLTALEKLSKQAAEDHDFIGVTIEKTSATDAAAAEAQLTKLADERVAKTQETFAIAYAEVLKTDTGRALFNKICSA